jgi:microcystin-dependent protein
MANPFLGEIKMFAGTFAPRGYQFCNGQILPIAQFTALFSLLGTNYGGNGTSNFALPNLQGMAPMHWGNGAALTPRVIGETSGVISVNLAANQVPAHNHAYKAGSGSKGEGNAIAGQVNCDESNGSEQIYATTTDGTVMGPGMIQATPATLPHENMQPYLAVNFIIAMQGVFPSRG